MVEETARYRLAVGEVIGMKGSLAGISAEEFSRLQSALDVEKWLASEQAGCDLCGSFSWCGYCVKAEKEPCARAQMRQKLDSAMDELVSEIVEKEERLQKAHSRPDGETREILQEEAAEEIAAEDLGGSLRARVLPDGYEEVTRYRRTFLARLIQNPAVQDGYTELKNALLGFAGVKARLCKTGENFTVGRKILAKFRITGKTLSVYLALGTEEFENSKYRFEDVSDKKSYAATPMRLRITSARAVRHAKELLRLLMQRKEVSEVGCMYTDFHYPLRSDEELLAEGLIVPYRALVKSKNGT